MPTPTRLPWPADLAQARTSLFVPGDRPDRIRSALGSGADAVIIDLEDAVSQANKGAARAIVAELTGTETNVGQVPVLVRVNEFGSLEFAQDVRAAIMGGAVALVVPKFVPGAVATELDGSLDALEAELGLATPLPVVGLIESAAGVLGLSHGATIPARVFRLAFGAADYHADLAISYGSNGPHTAHAMVTLVVASAAAGLAAPLDSPYFALDDSVGLADSVSRARAVGFGGKLCIHPNQLSLVQAGFSVTEAERRWAVAILREWESPYHVDTGAIQVDGELVDEAMVRRARQISTLS